MYPRVCACTPCVCMSDDLSVPRMVVSVFLDAPVVTRHDAHIREDDGDDDAGECSGGHHVEAEQLRG